MTVPPEAGSAADSGYMPIPEMNTQPQPSGAQSRPIGGAEVTGAGEMPMREMNAEPQSRPMSGAEVAGTGDMPIREMSAEPQQPGGGPLETAHEREKLAAYLRNRQGGQASKGSAGPGEMPTRDMNASG